MGYARERLAGLPAALRLLAVAELRRRGLPAADAAALKGIAEALAAGRDIAAQGLAHRWAAGEALPGAVQGSIRHASGRRQSLPRGIQGFEGEERESPEPAPEEAPDTAEPATPPASDRDGRLAAYVVLTPEEQRRVEGWTEGLRNGSVTLSGDELLLVMKAVMQRKRVSEDGSLTPEDARLLIAAYDAAQPDPAFLAVQETQRQALRALLIDDERVLDLERNWTRYTREQPEVFQATIIHMAGLVSQAFGIAEPPRVVFEELDGPEATYEPATNTITIVPDIALQGAGSLTYLTVIEEVYHAYQQQEAEALLAGRPQDPAVTRRAALWLLNGELYFNDRALGAMGIKDSYKGQPMEVDGASLKQPMTVILDEIRNKAG